MTQQQTLSVEQALELAVHHHQTGRLADAEHIYVSILHSHPNHPDALHLLGVIASHRGDNALAVELILKAVSIRPKHADAHNNIGNAYRKLRLREKAIESYKRAIEINPTFAAAYNNLGAVLEDMGKLENAVTSYEQALELKPDYPEAHCNLGAVLCNLGKTGAAVKSYHTALTLTPNYPQAHNNLGVTYMDMGMLAKAVKSFQKAITFNPEFADAYCNMGTANQALGHLDTAVENVAKALSLKPDFAKGQAGLVDVYLHKAQPQKALEICDDFLERHPGNTTLLAAKSFALADLGEMKSVKSLIDFDRFLSPQFVDVPIGYSDLAAFNSALGVHIESHPSLTFAPQSHATRAGRHSGELLTHPKGPIAHLEAAILRAVDCYKPSQQDNQSHPFIEARPKNLRLSIWGVIMETSGHQISHIHPQAWLSGVYYAKVPDIVADETRNKAGWIEFGQAPENYHNVCQPETRLIQPKPGLMVLFPSYFFHHTVPFNTNDTRISIAFDLIPEP